MGKKRQYTDEEKGVALAAVEACRGDLMQASRFTKIPRTTLQRWVNGQGVTNAVPQMRQHKKEDLADKLERLALTLAEACFEKVEDASLQMAATSLAIAIDKMQLLRQRPTQITETYVTPEARMERLAAIFDAAGGRRSREASISTLAADKLAGMAAN